MPNFIHSSSLLVTCNRVHLQLAVVNTGKLSSIAASIIAASGCDHCSQINGKVLHNNFGFCFCFSFGYSPSESCKMSVVNHEDKLKMKRFQVEFTTCRKTVFIDHCTPAPPCVISFVFFLASSLSSCLLFLSSSVITQSGPNFAVFMMLYFLFI